MEKKSRKIYIPLSPPLSLFAVFYLNRSFLSYFNLILTETFRRSDCIFQFLFHLDGGQISSLFKNISSTFYKNIFLFSSNLTKSRLNDFFRLWRILNFLRRWNFSSICSRLSPRGFINFLSFELNQQIYGLW